MASRIRTAILALLVALGLAAGLQATPASADEQVDIGVFQDRLAPYGQWVQHPRYGWVWYPTAIEAGWRPYTHGHWVWTDEYGWYWDSDYEWGWAPFHYGRWAFDADYGWIWVPGSTWAPAWVVWRSGGGYVGWAPMPPEAVWQGEIGFGGPELDVGYTPAWTFCEERYLAEPRLTIVPRERNVTIIKQTTNVTNYVTINNRIVNKSVDVHHIEKVSNTRITPVHIREVDRPASSAEKHATSSEVQVFRPTKKPPQATSKEPTRQQPIPSSRQGTKTEEAAPRPEIEKQGNPQNLESPKQQREIERQTHKQQEAVPRPEMEKQGNPQNLESPKQQREVERQTPKQQKEQKHRRKLECQHDPAAC